MNKEVFDYFINEKSHPGCKEFKFKESDEYPKNKINIYYWTTHEEYKGEEYRGYRCCQSINKNDLLKYTKELRKQKINIINEAT